jgi:aminopeptidase S
MVSGTYLDIDHRPLADQLTKTGVTNPEFIEFVGDDESPFIEAGIPVGGAENG